MESNHFDELQSEMFGASQEVNDEWRKYDVLIHQVFKQDENGAKLLAKWKEALIMSPTAQQGMDSVGIGINEGRKSFIRDILLTIERVENDG